MDAHRRACTLMEVGLVALLFRRVGRKHHDLVDRETPTSSSTDCSAEANN